MIVFVIVFYRLFLCFAQWWRWWGLLSVVEMVAVKRKESNILKNMLGHKLKTIVALLKEKQSTDIALES